MDERLSPALSRSTLILGGLTLCSAVLAGLLLQHGLTTWLEAASFVTGALCVWLTVRESLWNFPLGLVNEATFLLVFFRARLFADTGLQLIYFVLTALGWYLWLYGGEHRSRLRISLTPHRRGLGVAIAGLLMWLALTLLLRRLAGASPVWDALTTSLSLCAQWLLDRKHLENWLLWIAVDVMYVPLYLSKHLYLTSALYAVFLAMAILGLRAWYQTWRSESAAIASEGAR